MLRQGQKMLEMSEVNDVYEGVVYLTEIKFSGTGMGVGEKLVLRDGNGDLVARRTILAAVENETLLNKPKSIRDLKITEIPNGTVSVMASIR